jgi:hypothetical protein
MSKAESTSGVSLDMRAGAELLDRGEAAAVGDHAQLAARFHAQDGDTALLAVEADLGVIALDRDHAAIAQFHHRVVDAQKRLAIGDMHVQKPVEEAGIGEAAAIDIDVELASSSW